MQLCPGFKYNSQAFQASKYQGIAKYDQHADAILPVDHSEKFSSLIGSFGETGSPGISAASETALGAFQGHRQADRIAKGGAPYAGQKTLKMIY
jgi:hypothetical protein